jgi:oligopeptide/dipeptide ABC transporter ATP-binding protein
MSEHVAAGRPARTDPLLEVTDLSVKFRGRTGLGTAVGGISFRLFRGETVGLVGESGSGKTMTALAIMRLHPRPASSVSGKVVFDGVELLSLPEKDFRAYRGRRMALILQDPQSSLNPAFTVGNQLLETLRLHKRLRGSALKARAVELLKLLRIPQPVTRLKSFPHQLSGGMRQRVVGAIALSGEPELLIADEPTTALDVTIQLAYLTLLRDIQRRTGITILFITHDFSVVSSMCDRVIVMYGGRIMEMGPVGRVLAHPAHPYTQGLLQSVPSLAEKADRLRAIPGQPPSIYDLPSGCPFATRCPVVEHRCTRFPPSSQIVPGQVVHCWRYVA